MTSDKMAQKRYGLFVLAVLLLILAGAALILAPNSFVIRSLGLAAILISVWLVRASNVHRRSSPERGAAVIAQADKRMGMIGWVVGLGSLLAAGAAYLYLRNDALTGYHQVLPVYVFAGVGLTCAVIWRYIAVKLLQ